MDVLTEILDSIEFDTCLYFRTDLTSPWGIRVPKNKDVVRFHITLHGDFFIKAQKAEIKAKAGDIVFVTQGGEHDLYDSPKSHIRDFDDVIREAEYHPGELLKYGSPQGRCTQMVCGHFSFEQNNLHPFLVSLPDVLHHKASENPEMSWLNQTLSFLDYESQKKRPGDQAVVRRLSEIIFVQVIRSYLLKESSEAQFLSALKDQYISKSIEAIHKDPAHKWTLVSLAQAAGLSRSIFAERFRALTGLTPMEYLTNWRMDRAKRLLEDKTISTGKIGEQVGYLADEAFQKVFKRTFGVTPSQYRKTLERKKNG